MLMVDDVLSGDGHDTLLLLFRTFDRAIEAAEVESFRFKTPMICQNPPPEPLRMEGDSGGVLLL